MYRILCRTTAFKRETMEKKVSECFLLTPCHSHLVNLTPNRETNGLDWNCIMELLADNRQIYRHCLFSKKKLLYWKIFWMFLEVGGKWRRLEVTRRGRGSDGFCSLRGISYSPRATDWHTCTGRIVPMLRIVMMMKMRIVMTTMMLTTKQPTHPG